MSGAAAPNTAFQRSGWIKAIFNIWKRQKRFPDLQV